MADDERASSKGRKKRSRSGSGSRSKRRSRRSPSRSRSRSRSGGRSSRDRERRARSKSPIDPLEAARLKAEAEEREKHRDEYTVFVSQIHPKVDERDLFEFFSHVGRVEDIRLIRDQRTQKSKGLCYVEFWEKDSVLKGVALTGQLIGGFPISVSICQTPVQSTNIQDKVKPMKLHVSNLHPNVTERDLAPVFEAFGNVEYIDLHKDSSNKSKGVGYVLYKNEADAKAAMGALNGLEIAGRAIVVRAVESTPGVEESVSQLEDLDDNERGGLMMTSEKRAQLMQKLGRGNVSVTTAPAQKSSAPQVIAKANPALGIQMMQPTTCIVVKNMFDPRSETDPEFHLDIKEDVEEESEKLGAKPRHIHVDRENPQGVVYMRFKDIPAADKVLKAFNGRWFASRQIVAEFVSETTYTIKFPSSK